MEFNSVPNPQIDDWFTSFLKISLTGEGKLGISGANVKLNIGKVSGDNSGMLAVRTSQRVDMSKGEGHLPFSILAQTDSKISLPGNLVCRKAEVC